MKYKWKILEKSNPKNIARPKNLESYHPIIYQLLSNLGLETESVNSFLSPNLEDIPHPKLLSDIDKACTEILKYMENGQKVFIHGDFDADGIVATSILWDFLYRKLNINCIPIVPNRFDDGYGLSKNTIDKITEKGAKLVITVDCGIKDIEIIKAYPELKFIITDHHAFPENEKTEKEIPKAKNLVAVVHPQHPKSKYPNLEICGANVAWKLIAALNDKTGNKFDLYEYLDLVALATVTDIMPLKHENRIIVKKGVEAMKKSSNLGLNTLLNTVNLDPSTLQTYHLGYIIGPQFNAAGRIDDALDAVRLLSTKNKSTASKLAIKMSGLNTKRQMLTEDLLQKAEIKVNHSKKLIIIYDYDWPEGIIGLIAGKLCEKYHRPVIVMSIDKSKKNIRGSARSISKFNITKALSYNEKFLEKYGGHKQAAGFSVKYEKFEDFLKAIDNYVEENLPDEDLAPELEITSTLEPNEISMELIKTIELFEPFGNSNPKPKFLLKNFEVLENKIIGNGQKHYKLNISKNDINLTALAFNKKELIENIKAGDTIDVVGCPNINRWNGREYIQFEILDLKKSEL